MTVVFSKMKILSILSPIRREGDSFYFQGTMLPCLPANFNRIRFATVYRQLTRNGRASERGIRRSEVRFLMGTQRFFFVTHS